MRNFAAYVRFHRVSCRHRAATSSDEFKNSSGDQTAAITSELASAAAAGGVSSCGAFESDVINEETAVSCPGIKHLEFAHVQGVKTLWLCQVS